MTAVGGEFQPLVRTRTLPDGSRWTVEGYRPRVEGLFARIERWTRQDGADVHWRSISRDDVTTLYGTTAESRIADPADPRRVLSWLICESYDDRGNAIVYRYAAEGSDGVDLAASHERNRTDQTRSAARYLKRVLYGNRTPRVAGEDLRARTDWLFEAVLDYGEHDVKRPGPRDSGARVCRSDPFSTYRGGFEVRRYRLCRRVLLFHHFPDEPGVGADCLVCSTDLMYAQDPVATRLVAITQCGYRRRGAGYLRREFPPLELEYSAARLDDRLQRIEDPSLVAAARAQWRDLDGEGLDGMLLLEAGEWLYKRNLGPEADRVAFAPIAAVSRQPARTRTAADGCSTSPAMGGWTSLSLTPIRSPASTNAPTTRAGWPSGRSRRSRTSTGRTLTSGSRT